MRRTNGTLLGGIAGVVFALLLLEAIGVEVLPFL